MKTRIVKAGDSQGIRISRPLITQTGIGEEVDMLVEENRLVIAPVVRPRAEWAAAFREMARRGDDLLLDGDRHLPTVWEETPWEWS